MPEEFVLPKKKTAVIAGVLALTCLSAGNAVAATVDPSPQSEYCQPHDQRIYTATGTSWFSYDSGTLKNTSGGTISKTFTHSATKSKSTDVSAEVGLTVSGVVAELNAKFGVSTSVTASYTTSTAFTVTAPAHKTVTYKDGILQRSYSVKRVHTYSNCRTSATYGRVLAMENYSEAH
ncbi:hypothetical protein AB0F18_13310 [Streptomyces sp. NPDC029216]|uniref:hypothetical protein n=1 Tax=Streptomyces sp. NPDC029216 TaxID=3154701 RepID=UPI0033E51E00